MRPRWTSRPTGSCRWRSVPGDRRLPGAVGQRPPAAAQLPRRGDPPREMLPGGDLGGHGLAAGEPAVGQVQVAGPVGGLQVRGQGGLPGAARPGRPRHGAAGPHVGDLRHAGLRGGRGAGAGRAEVRGVAGLPVLPVAVRPLGAGDDTDGAVLGQHPQPVPAAVPPRPARPGQRPQPDRGPVPARRAGRRQHGPHAGQRHRPDLPAQQGQQPQERPDLQERISVRQRGRGRQVIARVGLPRPLRQRPQHRRRGPRLQRPGQRQLHHQPRRDLPRPPGRRPGQRLTDQRRAGHAAHQPQPGPLPHRPRPRRHPRRRQPPSRPRRDRSRRPGQRPAGHDPPARPGKLHQVPGRVLPDRRHRHHLGQARRRVPRRLLPAARLPPRPRSPRPQARRRAGVT